MWAANPRPPSPALHSPKVRALTAGQEAKMEGFRGHPRPIPKNLCIQLTQHPLAPALEACSVKPWCGGGGGGGGPAKEN